MFNKRTLSVIKRELKSKLFSRTFILMTLLIPVFMIGILGIQTFVMTYEGSEKLQVQIISENTVLNNALKKELDSQSFVKENKVAFTYLNMDKDQLKSYIEKNKKALLDDKITGIVFIPSSSLKSKKIEYYSKNTKNQQLYEKIRNPINNVLLQNYFSGKQLSTDEIQFVRDKVDITGYRISSDEKIEAEGYGNTIIAFLFTFLLYFSLLFIGTMMMRAVVEEKNNRIVEVLLSSVSSNELMAGKIIGTAITGVIQMTIWLLPLMMLISTSYFVLPEELTIRLSMSQILFFLYNYVIALVTYLGLFASLGAIFDNDQDAQSGQWPLMMLIMIPFFISIGMISNAENKIAVIGSMVPFASLIIMPSRITLVDVPLWQFILSIVINLAILFIIFPLAGKIYKVGILMTGKKPTWGEVAKWVKAS